MIAFVARALFHDQVSAERRWEDVLVREADSASFAVPEAEQTLRHTGILICEKSRLHISADRPEKE
jgi:hypothetical protein